MDAEAVLKYPIDAPDSITAHELFRAMTLFGDDNDTASYAGIIINSRMQHIFYNMDSFMNNTVTYVNQNNGIVSNGVIGLFAGVPVIVCDNNTLAGSGANAECKTYLVKKNSLAYILRRDIQIAEEYKVLLLATDIVASALYATKLVNDKGVVICRKTID